MGQVGTEGQIPGQVGAKGRTVRLGSIPMTRSLRWVFVMSGLSVALAAQTPATGTGEVNLTATSANVSEPGSPVKLRILRWSTDEERNPVVAALTPPAPASAPEGAAAGSPAGAGPSQPAAGGVIGRVRRFGIEETQGSLERALAI